MKIPEEDRKQILEAGKFLEDKNFVVEWSEFSVDYTKDNILIGIYYERYSDYSGVHIRFNDINKFYDVGWMFFVRTEKESDPYQRLQHVINLLSFIEQNFEQITSYEYCEESEKLIEEFFDTDKRFKYKGANDKEEARKVEIPEEDRKQILEAGKFLEYKNFVVEWNDYLISYTKDNILIKIYYEFDTFCSTVTVRFNDINKLYDVGWMAFVRKELEIDPHMTLQHVLIILSYIEQNFEQVTSYEFCEESERMIEEFFEEK